MSDRGFYWAEVVSSERVSPSFVRIRFGGNDLRDYVPHGSPDESVAIYFPSPGDDRPPAMQNVDGVWWFHETDKPEGRNYTVRRIEPDGTLVVDFVVHDGGVAASWALSAAPGDTVLFAMPRGWYRVPNNTEWQLLMADLAGLPALARIVEELPKGARAHVIAEVFDKGDVLEFDTAGAVTVDWRVGTGNGHGPGALVGALREWSFPEGDGYVWFAGEAADSRTVRKFVRRERGIGADRSEIIGYWRVRAEQWLAEYEKVESVVASAYTSALAQGRSEKEAAEAYDEMLENVGL
ncbi:siderophore-interacting protein [Actinomycetes bacterium M1A6_2h]